MLLRPQLPEEKDFTSLIETTPRGISVNADQRLSPPVVSLEINVYLLLSVPRVYFIT